jgi:3-phosphoglycerate kinase
MFYRGKVSNKEDLYKYLEYESILGGTKVEGVVIKNYNLFTSEKKIAVGKIVSERFLETAKINLPKNSVQELAKSLRTEARWLKAIQHLKEQGLLENSPRDIGILMKEINQDVLKECKEDIKDALFNIYWADISRELTRGFPDWYRNYLQNQEG